MKPISQCVAVILNVWMMWFSAPALAQSTASNFYDISTFTLAGLAPGISVEEAKTRLKAHYSIEESEIVEIRTSHAMPFIKLDNVVQFLSYKKDGTHVFVEFLLDLKSSNTAEMVLSSIKLRSKNLSNQSFLFNIINEYGSPTVFFEISSEASWCSRNSVMKGYTGEYCDSKKPMLNFNEFGVKLIDPKYSLVLSDHLSNKRIIEPRTDTIGSRRENKQDDSAKDRQ